jgi:hypothetical protein
MEPILVDDRLDLGQFSDLMDPGFGVVAGELMTATAAGSRLAVGRLANLLGRGQGAIGLAMSRLAATFPSAGRSRGLTLQTNRIRGWRLRRVGGVELEPVLEIMDARFKLGEALVVELDECKDRHLDFWRSTCPQRFWDRGRPCHAGRIVASFANDNPRL